MRINEYSFDDFDNEQFDTSELTVDAVDALAKEYANVRLQYDQISAELDAVQGVKKVLESKLISYVTALGKSRWDISGSGTVSVKESLSVTMPKDLTNKAKLLNYFREQGEDVYNAYVGVNSMTLNAYYRQMKEQDPSFHIDGLDMPTSRKTISFRRK